MATIDYFRTVDYVEDYLAGEIIFKEGDTPTVMYSVREGTVDIYHNNQHLESLSAGDIFGEVALLDYGVRCVTAIAGTDCKITPINRDRFLYLIQETPTFALQVMQTQSDRLRRWSVES